MPRLQVSIHGTSTRTGATWTITQQWALSSGPANALALGTVLSTAHTSLAGSTDFKASMGANYTVTGLHGLYYPVPGGHASIVADSSGSPITGTGTAAPIPLAIVVSERTNAAGASYRGRTYWPRGQANADGSVDPVIQTPVRAGWLAAHTLVAAALSGASYGPVHVVWSPKTGNMTPISYIQTGNRIDTARGRFGDAPETYVSEALPSSAQVTPQQVGLPDDATPEQIEQVNEFIAGLHLEGMELGPLLELAGAVQLALKVVPAE